MKPLKHKIEDAIIAIIPGCEHAHFDCYYALDDVESTGSVDGRILHIFIIGRKTTEFPIVLSFYAAKEEFTQDLIEAVEIYASKRTQIL